MGLRSAKSIKQTEMTPFRVNPARMKILTRHNPIAKIPECKIVKRCLSLLWPMQEACYPN